MNSIADNVVTTLKRQFDGIAPVALHEPDLSGEEGKLALECIDTGWVSSAGAYVDQFEKDIAAITGVKRAVAIVNGTAALHLALHLVGVRHDDEVLIPTLSFVATANACHYLGAVPHFIDSCEATLGVDPDKLREHLNEIAERTDDGCRNKQTGRIIRALVPMHTFGHPVNMEPLLEICQNFGIEMVEYAAESLGSYSQGRHTGGAGRVSALSFNGNKIVTTGGGGALLINDDELADLLYEIEEANNGIQITFFEILTVAYFHHAKKYPENINLIESGLFHRFDATNILKKNLASIVTAIGLDHLDWLPKEDQTVKKIIFEKTSTLLNSKIIIAKQSSNEINNYINNTIKGNQSKKITFNKNYSFLLKENDFFYFEDEFGGIKLPKPNLPGEFQLENVSTAIATARQLTDYKITDEHIKRGITKIESIARLQEIKSGKLKNLIKNNQLFIDGSHNPLGAKVLNQYLQSLNCKKHIILGMMANKNHNEYMYYFKNIETLTTIDIPNQPNAIKGNELKDKIDNFSNIEYKNSIQEAISSIKIQENDIILITGSLYLAGEILNLN